jgi:hypothetical protein
MEADAEKHNGSAAQSNARLDVEQVDGESPPPVTLEQFSHPNEKAILRKARLARRHTIRLMLTGPE